MSIILFILLILAVVVIVVMYRLNLKNKKLLEKKESDLKVALGSVKTELDKNIQTIGQLRTKGQYEIYAGQIVSQINQGIISIDQNRNIQLINDYAKQFLDVSPAVGKPYQEAINFLKNGERDYSLFESALAGKGQILSDNIELVSQKGKIPISGIITPLTSENNIKTVVFIFADNSQNVARIQEEKTFFSAATHELRTPLTVIRMSVALLLQDFDTLGREKIIEHLKKTNESIEHLVNLVNDFLNVSRIDQGRLAVNSTSFNIVSLTDEVIKELTPLLKERKLFIHHEQVKDQYRNVVGDPTKSREVLTNLISNSIKYTIQGGITVIHNVTDTSLITKISDTGNGIPTESQGFLFKRFTQIGGARLQSTSKSTGLGLYISKKFAQLMHGDIALETSEPGKGSTFTFTLPLVPKTS